MMTLKDKYGKYFCAGQTIVYTEWNTDKLTAGVIVNLLSNHNYTTSNCEALEVKNYETGEIEIMPAYGKEKLNYVIILPMICTKESLGIV